MEGRSLGEVAHLAWLGVNIVRTGILGIQKIKAASNRCFIFLQKYEIYGNIIRRAFYHAENVAFLKENL